MQNNKETITSKPPPLSQY